MNFTLNSVVYTPIGFLTTGASSWAALASGVAGAISRLTGRVNLPQGQNDGSVKWKLAIPVAADENSTCSCEGEILRTYYLSVESNLPRAGTTTERLDVYERLKSLVNDPAFKASIVDLVQPT